MLRSCRMGGRAWLLSLALTIAVFLFLRLKSQGLPPDLKPLPGTYQYFKETDFHSQSHRLGAVSHCDSRFAPERALDNEEIRATLKALLSSYATTMRTLNVETWLAHGILLGWYWNRKLLPWDTDIDVQVSGTDLIALASKHNFTEFEYPLPRTAATRIYLLDVNPHHSIISLKDVANKIDARWIDQTNGKYIDITAMHHDESDAVTGQVTSAFCKDGHRYKMQDIFPLEPSELEGIGFDVPKKSDKILREEYGAKALTATRFHWHGKLSKRRDGPEGFPLPHTLSLELEDSNAINKSFYSTEYADTADAFHQDAAHSGW